MRPGTAALLLAILLAVPASSGFAQPTPGPAGEPLLWPEEQRAFFQDGAGLLLSEEQRASFQGMDEAGRDAFIRGLLDRDPVPGTPENELRLGAERRRRLASLAFRSPLDTRFQILFLRGMPTARQRVNCRLLKPVEIWGYGEGQPRLIVYQPRPGEPFRLWLPADSRNELELPHSGREAEREACPAEADVTRAMGATLAVPPKLRRLPPGERARALLRPADLAAWAREAAATPLPPEPPRLETAPLEVDFPRRQGKRMTGRVLIPVVRSSLGGQPEASVTLLATVESQGAVIEEQSLRYLFPALVPAPAASTAGTVPLLLELRLPPGLPSLLRLRVREESAGAETLLSRALVAPSEPAARLGSEIRAAVRGEPLNPGDRVGRDALVLPPPPDGAVAGAWDAAPVVLGDRIVQAVFLVDGEVQSTVPRRPFAARLRLSSVPREQVVRVEGYDRDGELVAVDEVVLNRTRSAFKVELVEPRPASPGVAGPGGGPARARAEVSVPPGRRLVSVELRLNDVPVATLTSPPWEAQVDIPAEGELVYLSAVARLDNGFQAEDVRFLRAPEDLDRMNVRLVELSARVTDDDGRLVPDLGAEAFEVLEGGHAQPLVRFDRFKDLPLNLGLLIDTSSSMVRTLPQVQHMAEEFLEHVLRGQDRAFVLGFASRPYRLLASTERATAAGAVAAMGQSLPNLRAAGGTALYDTVVAALFELRSGQGRRALVVLSDGRDSSSHANLQQTLELARRGGVTIYAIGIDRAGQPLLSDGNPRGVLLQLAEATGGRSFFLRGTDRLGEVYRQIEEDLRSRYLLAYQTERGGDGEDRPVEVRVKRRGLKAQTARGYYP